MSTLRKVGAFLGLVPDDARYDGAEHEYTEYADNGGYPEQGYYDEHDYVDGADETGYSRSGYADRRRGGAAQDADYGRDTYAADSEYSADHQQNAAFRPTMAGHDERYSGAADVGAAYSDAQTEVSYNRQQSSADSSTRRSAKRGRSADTSGYQVQGSLAVQPDVRLESPPAEVTVAVQKPATITLTGFSDARDVGETYRNGQAVILDMTDLADAEARRMVDFAAGLAFAVRGSIDKVTTKVFMLHPPESDVSAETAELAFASR